MALTDEAFLGESTWRNTWPQKQWLDYGWNLPADAQFAQFVACYRWKSHLDRSLPEGFRIYLPAPWVSNALELSPNPADPSTWVNRHNEPIFQQFAGKEGERICLIRFDAVEELTDENCVPFSMLVSERNTWPSGSNTNAAWRRSEGISWKSSNAKAASSTWYRDFRNGSSNEKVG